jgi:hypothetical protein
VSLEAQVIDPCDNLFFVLEISISCCSAALKLAAASEARTGLIIIRGSQSADM